MNIKKSLLLHSLTWVLFFVNIGFCYCQDKETDSLKNMLRHMKKDDTTKVILLNKIAYNYYGEKIDDLTFFATKAISLSIKLNYLKGEAIAYKNMGLGNMLTNGDPIALEYFDRSFGLFVQLKDNNNQARVLNNIGYYYSDLKDFHQSLNYFNQAFEKVKSSRNSHLKSILLGNIGNEYIDLGDYTNAAKYYNQELFLASTIPEKDVLIISYINLSDLAIRQHNYTQAQFFINHVSTYKNNADFRPRDGVDLLRLQGEINYALKNYAKANELLLSGLNIAKALGSIDQKVALYQNLYLLDSATNNYRAAMINSTRYHQLNDSINNNKRIQLIALYQIKFDLEKRKEENEHLVNAAEKYKATIIFQRSAVVFIFTILVVIVVILFYFKKINNQINKKNEVINLQNKVLENTSEVKDKIFSVISHDIRSPIIQMMSLLTLWEDEDVDYKEMQGLTNAVKRSITETLEMIDNLLTWSKNQLHGFQYNPIIFNLNLLIDENIQGFDTSAKNKSLLISNNIPADIEIEADRDMIKIVVRNLLSNAVKFTPEKGSININHTIKGGYIVISVEDSGVGIKNTDKNNVFAFTAFTTLGTNKEKGTGLGLKLCQDFIRMNKGTISMESKQNEGSKFFISLPYSQ